MLLGTIINTLTFEYTPSANFQVLLLISLKYLLDSVANSSISLLPWTMCEYIHSPNTNFRCCHLKLITVLLFLNIGSFWHHSSTMIGGYEHWRPFWEAVAAFFISWRKVEQSKKVRLSMQNFWLFRILCRSHPLQLSCSVESWEAMAWIWRQCRKETKSVKILLH